MLRQFSQRLSRAVLPALRQTVQPRRINPAASCYCTNVTTETERKVTAEKIATGAQKGTDMDPEDAVELGYVRQFQVATDIWEVEDVINMMHQEDRIPLPDTVIVGLNACRRVNDHSLAIRFMESVRYKCILNPPVWDYISQEIEPTLKSLNIASLKEMGYTEPELAMENPDYIYADKFKF